MIPNETKIYPSTFPDLEDWPIYRLSEDRLQFIDDITQHTYQLLEKTYGPDYEKLLSKTIYLEKIRLKEEPWKADPPKENAFWNKIRSRLKASYYSEDKERIQDELLKIITQRYAEEIVGNFRIKTFKFARKFLTIFFGRLLNTAAERNHRRLYSSKYQLYDKFNVRGPLEKIRQLSQKGTVIVVPTHFSNLDSILIGYAIDSIVGLPALSYGAGLNLYNSEFVGYFFNRLGAYRIDRRKKNMIYLNTLKAMSSLSIQRGVHSLFFPGGTRSRSGAVEDRFKLGLLGTVIEAQRSILEKNVDNKIFIVPLVLGYHSVLEANFLINQHLSRTGREKFWASKDEFKSLRSILKFAWKFFSVSSNITLSFGDPLDIAGNRVDDEGNSFDENKHPIDIKDYFLSNDHVGENRQREQVYTRQLSQVILKRFLSDNIVLSSHVVAFVAFSNLKALHPNLDIFGLIRLPADDFVFNQEELLELIKRMRAEILKRESQGLIKASEMIRSTPQDILRDGIKNLGIYHNLKPLKYNKNDELISQDFKLLYYYHNRLTNYEFEESLDEIKPVKAKKEMVSQTDQ